MHDAPAVTCTDCQRAWHSPILLEGLALLGYCPRCGGALEFHRSPQTVTTSADGPRFDRRPPHLVLGRPRRSGRRGGPPA